MSFDCLGLWQNEVPCDASCDGSGTVEQRYKIFIDAIGSGAPCPVARDTTRQLGCFGNRCEPPSTTENVNCAGEWRPVRGCDAACGQPGSRWERYEFTQPAINFGLPCFTPHGAVRAIPCEGEPCEQPPVTPIPEEEPVAVDCIGEWQVDQECDAECESSGIMTHRFVVSQPAAHGGHCQAADGATREQACNGPPCPVDCIGSWQLDQECNAECESSGVITERFVVTQPAMHNGHCEADDGATREQACVNSDPCPVPCVGDWHVERECDAECESSGFMTQRFVVTRSSMYDGHCEAEDGATREQACVNSDPCPVDCIGSWQLDQECNAECESSGFQTERFVVTRSSMYDGHCEAEDGATRQQACVNSNPCPVDCIGSWQVDQECDAECESSGFQTERFVVTQPAMHNGHCEADDGATREQACVNSNPCPVPCVGEWQVEQECDAECESSGVMTERFVVSQPAMHNGDCEAEDGATWKRWCVNSDPCPVDCEGYWSQWSNCNGSCGGGSGTQSRSYVVTKQPAHEGMACPASPQTQNCTNTNPCPVTWTDWIGWYAIPQTQRICSGTGFINAARARSGSWIDFLEMKCNNSSSYLPGIGIQTSNTQKSTSSTNGYSGLSIRFGDYLNNVTMGGTMLGVNSGNMSDSVSCPSGTRIVGYQGSTDGAGYPIGLRLACRS